MPEHGGVASTAQPFYRLPLKVFLLICAQADWQTLVRASHVSHAWGRATSKVVRLRRELEGLDMTSETELGRVGVWAERGKGEIARAGACLKREGEVIDDEVRLYNSVSQQALVIVCRELNGADPDPAVQPERLVKALRAISRKTDPAALRHMTLDFTRAE